MEELQKLYDVLVREGKYSKSFEEFQTKWSNDAAYKNKVYTVVTRDGLYSKDKDSFFEKYSTPELIVKKKVSSESAESQVPQAGTTGFPSEDGSSDTQQSTNKFGVTSQDLKDIGKKQPTDMSGKPLLPEVDAKLMKSISERPKPLEKIEKQKSYNENLGTSLMSGLNDVNKMISSIPETVYNVFSWPQQALAYATGLDISTNADKFKKNLGITNPVLDYYKEEGKKLEAETAKFNKENYKSSSIYKNLEDGNYQDAFELLGTGIARSAPTSIAIMAGGATMSTAELATASTAAFYNQNLEELQEENPNASDIENSIKALGMSAAESVFSAIGEGQIGAVYRDIIRKEGAEVGKQVFKDGLVQMYKGALEKYGVPVGLMGEGIEESATQITQNMISGKPAFQGAADAFILGGGSGVMFTSPISLKNANDRINNKVKEVQDKKQINLILDGSTDGLNKVFDVAKDSEINEKQLSIASLDKSRDLLVKDLDRGVKKGDITKDQAKQSLYVFDKTKQITGQLRGVDIDEKSKVTVANLLKERESLSDKIQGKDDALSVLEKQRISEINDEIKQTILKSKEDAIQEQTTDESVLRTEQPELELQGVGEGNAKPKELTEEQKIADAKQKIEDERIKSLRSTEVGDLTPFIGDTNRLDDRIENEKNNIKFYKEKGDDSSVEFHEKILAQFEKYKPIFDKIDSKYNEQLKDLEKPKETITTAQPQEVVGIPDEVSQPIELSVSQEVTPTETTAEPQKEQWEIDYEKRKAKVDEFNAENRPSALEKEKVDLFERKNSEEKRKLQDEVFEAQQKISRADDTDLAIEDYNKKKQELQSFDDESQNIQNQRDIDNLIYDEIEYKEKDGDTYEFPEEFNKDPREAALKRNKEMIDFLEERKADNDLEAIDRYKNNIKLLEQDIKENPLKKNTVVAEIAPVETTTETAPVVELNELLDLDTKDKTSLKKVFDYLDKLDKSLDINPNELNDVTRVMAIGTAKAVIKTLKALVNAGITLQEAINTAAEIHSVNPKDVLKAFDVINQNEKQKSAPSPVRSDIYIGDGRLVSIVKDIKKITMTEKALLVKQIRDKIRGAKDVIKTIKEVSQQLVKDIKELESKGKITPTQALNMISKFNKVNMLNEVSVSNFVDYMTKVFADADYDNKINIAKGKLKNARKNIATKIGIADGLVGPLQKLFAINPELIPQAYLERYLELVDMFGARQAVLNLEEKSKVTKDVIEILDEINNERSAVDELSERLNYSENKVIEDGKLNYAATVKNMLKEGEITEEEAALMSKYKSEIVPKTEKSTLSEEELQQEKDELLAEVKKSTINADDLPTRAERDAAKKLATLIKSPAVKELSNSQLKNLLKVIDNINNGYFAHSAQLIIEEINSNNNSKSLKSSILRAVLLPLSKLYAQAKSIVTRKDAVLEMIRRNPLFNIDQVLGDFKTKDVFNSLLEKAAEGEAKFTAELKAIQSKLSTAEEKIANSFTFKDKLNANKALMSKFKMMTYMVQLEYQSNPDSKQVNPASKFIEATINHIQDGKSQFGEKDAEMLQDILDNYTDADGNVDIKKLYDSFNGAEKAGIKTIQEVNQSLKEKAEYTASVIRGQRINPLSNYIHLNVLSDTKPNDLASGESFADQYNNSLKPSTKAKSLIERTGKVSPLNFDVFASAQKGAKFVLMDYHLTEPIRTARKTINKTITALGKENKRIINAISNSFEETVENLVNNSYMETSVGDDVANYIKKQGYRAVLAGTGRFAAEFLSNVGFVIISDPTTFAEGLKYTSTMMSPDAPLIMHNVNSKEINRIFPSDTLSGRLIDTNILNEANGIKGGKAKNKVINKVQQIWNLTGKKYTNSVELTADVSVTTPDKVVMRPIWFGAFATNFKKQTGQDVDFKKIAANDEAYMNENRETIDKAKDAADERSVITGASNNAFTGILKGTSKPNQSNFIKGFNNFNNFMSRFLIYEYTSARTGIMAAMGNGSLDRRQGIALLGAVTTRMTVYSLLSKALGSGLLGLLFGDDDDEEDEKSLDKSIGQALTSSFTSLLFNRDFGNASKAIINEGIERINENYLQALREGDYDPYKDAIQYTAVPIEKKGKQTSLYDYIESVSGAYGPAIKTTNLIIKTYSEDDKKEFDAIQRQKDVKNIRIPLEVLGNAGFIPLYKDIRKEVMKDIYKGLNKKAPVLRTVKKGDEFK